MKALAEAGRAADAYALGKRNPDSLGDPAFDFFFGAAAVESGHAAEGVLALERYLLHFPDNTTARLLLARGYFLLREDARARAEFESLRSTASPEVTVAVDRYLDAIRVRQDRTAPSGGGYVEFGFGRDTNVNAGPSAASIFIPGFGVQPLAVGSRKSASTFESLSAGGYYNHPVQPGVSLFVQGQGERRFHNSSEARRFEVGTYNATVGASVLREQDLFRLGISYGLVTLASDNYRRGVGASLDWQHRFDDVQSLSLGAQVARFSYGTTETSIDGIPTTVDNSPRDADFRGVTAVYKRALSGAWDPVLTVALNAGDQHSRAGHPELVPRSYGASVGVNFSPAPKWGVLAGFAYQQSRYHGPDFFADPDSRRDEYRVLDLALTYLISRNLTIRGEAQFSRNSSNAQAYEFPRTVFGVKLRYEFK